MEIKKLLKDYYIRVNNNKFIGVNINILNNQTESPLDIALLENNISI